MAPILQARAVTPAGVEEKAVDPGHHDASHNPHSLDADGVDRLVDDLRMPLTAILGYSQLLQRRLRHGDAPDAAYLLARLAAIERSTQDIETRLQVVEHESHGG